MIDRVDSQKAVEVTIDLCQPPSFRDFTDGKWTSEGTDPTRGQAATTPRMTLSAKDGDAVKLRATMMEMASTSPRLASRPKPPAAAAFNNKRFEENLRESHRSAVCACSRSLPLFVCSSDCFFCSPSHLVCF